jgi:hypothetical protein
MGRQCKHKRTAEPTRPAAHSGTFTFFQPRLATAHKNVKDPKFTNRTPTTPSFSIECSLISKFFTALIHFDPT